MRRILSSCVSMVALIAVSCSSPVASDPAGNPSAGAPSAGAPSVAGPSNGPSTDDPEVGEAVADIASIADLRQAFTDDGGTVRIVLSMSPT